MRPITMSAMLGLPLFGVAQSKSATGIAAQARPLPSHRSGPRPSLDTLCPAQRGEVPVPGLPAVSQALPRVGAAAGKDVA